jgi:hypothetical protein
VSLAKKRLKVSIFLILSLFNTKSLEKVTSGTTRIIIKDRGG